MSSCPIRLARATIHDVIYDELVQGHIRSESKAAYLAVIDRMIVQGAQGVTAGCTEIQLLVAQSDLAVAYFPTARLHALAAVDAALVDA